MKGKPKILTAGAALLLTLFVSILPQTAAGAATEASAEKPRYLRYYAVDVGQGDCSLFILPGGETIVVDAGPQKNALRTVRYLKSCGVKKINLLVATHPHEDHIGGMTAVLSAFDVERIWDSGYNYGSRPQRDFYGAIRARGVRFGKPKAGSSYSMGDVSIDVLAPVTTLKNTHSDANNNGLVLLITYGDISFLMTGDMEREQRATLGRLPKATVLKASHHGSYNGTDEELLREVAPDAVILSYERGNDYGYPHREVVKAIRDAGILRFDTANGAVKIRTDGKTFSYERKRVVK